MKYQGAGLNTQRKKEKIKKKNDIRHQTGIHFGAYATNLWRSIEMKLTPSQNSFFNYWNQPHSLSKNNGVLDATQHVTTIFFNYYFFLFLERPSYPQPNTITTKRPIV